MQGEAGLAVVFLEQLVVEVHVVPLLEHIRLAHRQGIGKPDLLMLSVFCIPCHPSLQYIYREQNRPEHSSGRSNRGTIAEFAPCGGHLLPL